MKLHMETVRFKSIHAPKSIHRITPKCRHIPLHNLMTYPLTNLLVEFNLEGS
jgi:hypothetical protein